jgi:hypothetical protein
MATREEQQPAILDKEHTHQSDKNGNCYGEPGRDANVSDAEWHQLSLDKAAAVAREAEYNRLQEEKRQDEQRIADLKKAEQAAVEEAERFRLEDRIRAELEKRRKEG